MYAERVAFETGMFEDELMRAGLLGHLTDALVRLELTRRWVAAKKA